MLSACWNLSLPAVLGSQSNSVGEMQVTTEMLQKVMPVMGRVPPKIADSYLQSGDIGEYGFW